MTFNASNYLPESSRKKGYRDGDSQLCPTENNPYKRDWQYCRGELTAHGVLVTDPLQTRYLRENGCYGTAMLPGWLKRTVPSILTDESDGSEDAEKDVEIGTAEENSNASCTRRHVMVDENAILTASPQPIQTNSSTIRPRSAPKLPRQDHSVVLFLEEAFFLSFALGRLVVRHNGRLLDLLEMWRLYCRRERNFARDFAVYHHFRSRGWIPKLGAKFGGTYLLYRTSLDAYHSTYIVHIIGSVLEGQVLPIHNSACPPSRETSSSTSCTNAIALMDVNPDGTTVPTECSCNMATAPPSPLPRSSAVGKSLSTGLDKTTSPSSGNRNVCGTCSLPFDSASQQQDATRRTSELVSRSQHVSTMDGATTPTCLQNIPDVVRFRLQQLNDTSAEITDSTDNETTDNDSGTDCLLLPATSDPDPTWRQSISRHRVASAAGKSVLQVCVEMSALPTDPKSFLAGCFITEMLVSRWTAGGEAQQDEGG